MGREQIRATLRIYQRAVAADPTNVQLRRQLARYLAAMGYKAQAVDEFELSAKLLAARGELLEAIACSKQVLSLDPTRTDILLFLTRHYASAPAHGEQDRVAVPVRTLDDLSDEPAIWLEQAQVIESIELTMLTLDGDDEDLEVDLALSAWEALPEHGTPPSPAAPGLSVERIAVPDAQSLSLEHIDRKEIPLFSVLPPAPFVDLLKSLEWWRVPAGATIRQADLQTQLSEPALFILVEGHVAAELDKEGEQPVDLGEVTRGGFFGEFELLTGKSQDVRWFATTASELLVLPKSVLSKLCHEHPTIYERLQLFYRKRLVRSFLASSQLFSALEIGEREMLARKFKARHLHAGEVVLREGDAVEGLYLLLEGSISAIAESETVAELSAGQFFGVRAMASREKCRATVMAREELHVLILPSSTIRDILKTNLRVAKAFEALAAQRENLTKPLLVGSTDYSRSGFSK